MTHTLPAPTAHFYASQRLRLHYLDWGNAGAPPLVLLHGGRDHCRNWDWTVQKLRQHWRILTPDLRGHGDSQWNPAGQYHLADLVFDLAELVEQQQLAPVTLVGHSLGGNICIRFAGIYPDKVRKVVSIEGLGPSPKAIARENELSMAERMQQWVTAQREVAARMPRRYASVVEACQRMQEQNPHLSAAQAAHLTQHGVRQHEDGSYGWKFDNFLHSWPPIDMTREQIQTLWARITCPTLLIYGNNSWASNPLVDGRAQQFKHATVATVEKAGHWLHHDQLEQFVALLHNFL